MRLVGVCDIHMNGLALASVHSEGGIADAKASSGGQTELQRRHIRTKSFELESYDVSGGADEPNADIVGVSGTNDDSICKVFCHSILRIYNNCGNNRENR